MLKVNLEKTLEKYRRRLLQEFEREDFLIFKNKFIGCYEIWSTFPEQLLRADGSRSAPRCAAHELFRILTEELHIKCLGITSMRKKFGKFIAQLPDNAEHNESTVVYVGKHNWFTGVKSSPFRLLAKDYVREHM